MYLKSYLQDHPWVRTCLDRDDWKCQRCGSTSKLLVHHIDNSRVTHGQYQMNNELSNLLTLCRPCHSRVHGLTSNYHDVPEMRAIGMSYAEIGKELGISRQRVHQLYKGYIQVSGLKVEPMSKRKVDYVQP